MRNPRKEHEASAGRLIILKDVRGSGPPLFSPPSKVSTAEEGALQHRADGDGRKKKAYARLPVSRTYVRGSAPSLFFPPSKVRTAEGGTLQNHADGYEWRRKAHALFPDYKRDACLVPTLTRARIGGCHSDGGTEEEVRIDK